MKSLELYVSVPCYHAVKRPSVPAATRHHRGIIIAAPLSLRQTRTMADTAPLARSNNPMVPPDGLLIVKMDAPSVEHNEECGQHDGGNRHKRHHDDRLRAHAFSAMLLK